MKTLFIAGATGYLGQHLVRESVQQNWQVTALTRADKHCALLSAMGARPIVAQATKPQSLRGCMENIDVVISTLGITRQKDGLSYMDVDYQANVHLLDEALRAGVKHFVYVATFRGETLKAKSELIHAKERFVTHLLEANIKHSIIRPTGFYSDMSEFIEMAKRGRTWLIGSGQQNINPIHGADLALRCLEAIEHQEQEVAVGGPERFTFREIAEMAFDVLEQPAKISSLPQCLTGITAKSLSMLTPQSIYGPIEMFLAASTLDMVAPMYGTQTLRAYFESLTT